MQAMWARRVRAVMGGALLGWAAVAATPAASAASSCQSTGALDRDGTALTARLANPSKPVSGTVDARGCDVGVYFSRGRGLVVGADVFGARYYGVLVDGNGHDVAADVRDSRLHDLGDPALTASRHGQGIAWRGFGGTASGTASGNRIWDYQEAGINMTGPGTTARAVGNVVTGRGATNVISQNGIQVIHGAHGSVDSNRISELRFTGPNIGNGILVVGGPGYGFPYTTGTRIERNVVTNADVGIDVFVIEDDGSPSAVVTRAVISDNVVRNNAVVNTDGWSDGLGFQAGIADYANSDTIVGNVVSGAGYDPDVCGAAAICAGIFTDGSIDPTVSGNVVR